MVNSAFTPRVMTPLVAILASIATSGVITRGVNALLTIKASVIVDQ